MKCIRCGHDAKYSERPNRTCPRCKGTFAFEPQQGDPLTDRAFSNAISAVSGSGTVGFLPKHVYYHLNPPPRWQMWMAVVTAVISWLVGLFVWLASGWIVTGIVYGALALVGVLAGFTLYMRSGVALVTFSRSGFDIAWARWLAVHGPPDGLIASGRRLMARPPALEAELRSYSFDRAVICDTPELVDLLVANRFHFENNCAVLSEGGYPESAFDTVRAMLANNPKLLVLAIHDATPDGCRLAHRLANDPEWFAGGTARVVDVGLRPAHAKSFRGRVLLRPSTVPVQSDAAITKTEADWLTKYALETAAIRPEQLVKRLYRAMTVAESSPWTGTDGGSGGVYLLGDATGTVDGGADSFG